MTLRKIYIEQVFIQHNLQQQYIIRSIISEKDDTRKVRVYKLI